MAGTTADLDLWGLGLVAKYLGLSVSHTRQRIVTLPDFPASAEIGVGKRSQPRWFAEDVRRWVRSKVRRKAA